MTRRFFSRGDLVLGLAKMCALGCLFSTDFIVWALCRYYYYYFFFFSFLLLGGGEVVGAREFWAMGLHFFYIYWRLDIGPFDFGTLCG